MINKVILIGNIGKEPEIRKLENGTAVTSFSLATSDNYKDKSGEWQEVTDWHKVVAWRDLAERCAKYPKGCKVYVEGKLKTRKSEQDGQTRYFTEVVANTVRSLQKIESTQTESNFPTSSDAPESQPDDDLPF